MRPPQHQHGLSSSHNTPSVCSPVVPVRQVLPSPSSACLWSLTTHVSVRLSPDLFQFRNVVPACYTDAQRVLSLSTSVKIRFSLSSASPLFCFHFLALCPRCRLFSSAGLCCCRTVRRNTELQVDQKPLQQQNCRLSVFFFFSVSLSVIPQQQQSDRGEQEWRKEATAEVGVKMRGGRRG